MRVPQIWADYQGDVARVPNAGAGAYARANAADTAVDIAGHVARQEAVLREREQVAKDSILAIELDGKMGQAVSKAKESFLKRSDFENFDGDVDEQIKAMKDEFTPQNASPELNQAFARSFNKYTQSLSDSVASQKYRVMEQRGRNAIGQVVDNAAEEYAAAVDPAEKEMIKKGTELRIRGAINQNLVDPVWGENQIRGFEQYAKGKEVDVAEAIIIERMGKDPAQLAVDLENEKYLPGLTDKSKRASFINHAKTAAKMQQAEMERKTKEIQTELHDKEDRAIGNLFMMKDYSKAYAQTLASKFLTGDEKRIWASAIDVAQRTPIKVDPALETKEIVNVNRMIIQDKPVDEIRNFIIQNPNLGEPNKEQYLNKLETKYSDDMKEIRSFGLQTIINAIIPKRGKEADFLETPLETNAVANSQIVWLDWLEDQVKAGKRITRTEGFYKAGTIASGYKISIADQIRYMQLRAQDIKLQIKQLEEEKSGIKKKKNEE